MKQYVVVDVTRDLDERLDSLAERGYVVREVIQGFYIGDRQFVGPKIIMEGERATYTRERMDEAVVEGIATWEERVHPIKDVTSPHAPRRLTKEEIEQKLAYMSAKYPH